MLRKGEGEFKGRIVAIALIVCRVTLTARASPYRFVGAFVMIARSVIAMTMAGRSHDSGSVAG
ncbi:hypothetical protein HSR122_1004 [Halapricum desulfuricans]|uniref:Uncharacterized protein n=1 Tax=Halapricum desulfuricans TaxID=2841257 RepID=A0A897NDC7_9EURY|nr:hypothetical protein HSR122_1004 [Halapricum desulfuricans]